MDWKKLGKKLLFPPSWLIFLLAVISAVALTVVFIKGWQEHPVAYGVYALSAYALTVLVAFCSRVLPGYYRAAKENVYQNPVGNRMATDRVFRTKVSLTASLCINFLYVGIQLLSWYLYRSWWFVVLAVYYGMLSVMRFLLAGYLHRNAPGSSMLGEWKRSRLCACILLLVNLSLSGAVLMILYQNRGYEYHGILIYVMAAYTFYMTVHAVIELIKSRKSDSPVLSTAKTVSLSSALVSMLNLETAMFSQFGGDFPPESQRLMIILTGAGVSATVITLSVLLIVRATKEINNGK